MARSLPTPPLPDSPTFPCHKLRHDLEELYVPKGHDVPDHLRFFPKSCIAKLFTDDRIKEVLECHCSSCQDQKRVFGSRDPDLDLVAITCKNLNDHRSRSCAIVLFALLVFIECPSLIYSFLDKRVGDRELESDLVTFTAEYVQRKYWPKQYPRFADKFHWLKFKFFVPCMRDDRYEEYPKGAILPFVNEQRLGRSTEAGEIINEGSFGTVFAFEIVDEYRRFSEFPGVRRFARKQLDANTPYERFKAELDNLMFVKRLQDDHLVKIVKAYKHGEFYNFIFPCAKTNLGLYLRDPHFRPYQNSRTIVEHPVWRQFLGLARGLHRVLDCEEPKAHSATHFGYHFDLKPANILVDDSERLLITDFGHATFKEITGTTSSKVAGRGGTEAYAPPEIDGEGNVKQNRRYDIWSLGCVLVEICAFVARGSQGVLSLDRTRLTKIPGTNYTDDRFFRPKFARKSYELKPEIKLWIQQLPQSAPDINSRNFLNEVLLLALQMLDVEVQSRLTSKEVCIRYANILDRFQKNIRASSETYRRAVQSTQISGSEVGKELIERLSSLDYNVAGDWRSGPVRFTRDEEQLYIHTLEDHRWAPTMLGDISQLRVVPRHALRDEGSHYFSDASLYLLPSNLPQDSTRGSGKFSAKNIAGDLILQEIFLGQEVSKNLLVKAAHLEQKHRKFLLKTFPRRRNSELSQLSIHLEHQASSVQLWTEKTHGSILEKPSSPPTSRRQSPRSLRLGPPPRRIVVFYEHSIVLIRIGKNVRIKLPDQPGNSLFLVPTDKKTDPSFRVSVFRAKSEDRSPTLPLDRDTLEFEEEENNLECSCLTLEFKSSADATSFNRSYIKVKKKWAEEVKAFEACQKQVGPEFGYARS